LLHHDSIPEAAADGKNRKSFFHFIFFSPPLLPLFINAQKAKKSKRVELCVCCEKVQSNIIFEGGRKSKSRRRKIDFYVFLHFL
jgi:hypothetical protein